MKQVLQNLDDGATHVVEVPAPMVGPKQVLVRTGASVVSAGTERMLVEFGQANLLQKARQQPERVRDVIDKALTDGIAETIDAVRSKLSEPIPLGYTAAGTVLEVGSGVTRFQPGDRVATNGPHAEVVCVPEILCAEIPDGVSDEVAAFTPIGAIALQGLRLAAPTLGERFVVTGLGLVGLLTAQLLRANGCRVLGIDLSPERAELAATLGIDTLDLTSGEDPLARARSFSEGRGVDGVIIAASTSSTGPIRQAAEMCRKRGRIVLVGVTGLDLDRSWFYEKELSFQVSASYGPGRYDNRYEEHAQDYPFGYVRWTAQRNFEAVLDRLADGSVEAEPLITHRFALRDADEAYATLTSGDSLGIVLEYPEPEDGEVGSPAVDRTIALHRDPVRPSSGTVAVIGAGHYATRTLLPALQNTPAALHTVVSRGGTSAGKAAERFRFQRASTDVDAVLDDPLIDAVIIATRHDSHADLTVRALTAGKHVYVEKPLAITHDQLAEVRDIYMRLIDSGDAPTLMVGFNRRFSPLTVEMRAQLQRSPGPKSLLATVNAGHIPSNHWIQDPAVGGGRIIGEACHFIDLLRHLAGAPIETVRTSHVGSQPPWDNASIQLQFADGSVGTVVYTSGGSKRFPKERIEVFADGGVLQLDNFRILRGFGTFDSKRTWGQNKGHVGSVTAFIEAVRYGGPPPIPLAELLNVSAATLEAAGQ